MQARNKVLTCHNHPGKKSSGICSVCGKPICENCAIYYKSRYFCIETCIPDNLHSQRKTANRKGISYIIFWGTTTLILALTLIICWSFREIKLLQQENQTLQENRMHLISALKSSNLNDSGSVNSPDSSSLSAATSNNSSDTPDKKIPSKAEHIEGHKQEHFSENYTFNNGPADRKLVSLTFDGGADANIATAILDTLHSRDIKATIFLTGQFIKKFPDIVHLCVNEGHEIGNHTFNHPHLTSYAQTKNQISLPNISREFIHNELMKNDNLFFNLTGQHMARLWRAPYGEFNRSICQWALDDGYVHVGWRQGRSWRQSLDSNDWIPNEETPGFKTPSEVMDKILSMTRSDSDALNGGIILMHLGTDRKDPHMQVYTILGALIDSLRQRDYQIVTVSEMIRQSGYQPSEVLVKN